jgi:hypothetical protein
MIADREELTFPLIDEVLTWIETYLLSDIIPEDRRPVDETDAKIAHNKLSDEAAETIYETYADFPQVRDFLRQTTGRRGRLITSAIKQLYRDRRAQDQSPDDIFWGLIRDVTPPRAGEAKRYACTVLISYFFHACEVFERVNPRQI